MVTSRIISDKFEDIVSLATHDRRKDFIDKIKRPHLVHGKKFHHGICMAVIGLALLIYSKNWVA